MDGLYVLISIGSDTHDWWVKRGRPAWFIGPVKVSSTYWVMLVNVVEEYSMYWDMGESMS